MCIANATVLLLLMIINDREMTMFAKQIILLKQLKVELVQDVFS